MADGRRPTMIIVPPPIKHEVETWLRQNFGEPSPFHPFVHVRHMRTVSTPPDARYALGDGHAGDPPDIYRVWIRDNEDRILFMLRWSRDLGRQ